MQKLLDVSDDDVQVIEDTIAERLSLGISQAQAQRQAVDEALAQLADERAAVMKAVDEQLGTEAANEPEIEPEQEPEQQEVADEPAPVAAKESSKPIEPAPKPRAKPTPNTPVSQVRSAIEEAYGGLLSKLEGKGLVTVTQTQDDAMRAAAQARAEKYGGDVDEILSSLLESVSNSNFDIRYSDDGHVQGFFDPQTGQSFLVADHLTETTAPGVLMHEVGIHMAADGAMEPVFNRAKDILKAGRGNKFIDAVRHKLESAGETSGEEAAAYLVEAYENDRVNAPASVVQWIKDFFAAVRAWAFKRGILIKGDQLTVADIAAIARANARKIAISNTSTSDGGDIAASVTGTPEANALQELSKTDDLFKFQRSEKDTVEGIAKDINPAITVKKLTNIPGETRYTFTTPDGNSHRMMVRPFNPYANDEVQTMYGFNLDENHEMTDIVTERPGKNAEHALGKDDVYIDVSLMRPGEYGSAIYAIAQNYAHNTGKIFIGDPSGLSDNAMKRRVENMLSSALKFGTTEHLAPHPRQVKGDASIGVPPLDWTYGDDLANISALIKVSDAIYGQHNPLTFQSSTGRFVDSEGAELDESAIRSIIEDGRFRKNGIGIATAKRNAVLSALVREAGAARSGVGGRGNGLLEKIVDLTRQHPYATRGLLYSRASNVAAKGPSGWEVPPDTRSDKLIQKLQDGRVDLKRVQQAIQEATQSPIPEAFDARLAETLYMGRVTVRADKFLELEAKPLLEAMAKNGATMDELSDYLMARHAPERNAQIAKVNPDMKDGGAGTNSQGVLMTTQAANDYIAGLSTGKKLLMQQLAKKVDAITAGTRDLLVGEGLETKEAVDTWQGAYKHYVPLFKDEAEAGGSFPSHPQGSGFSIKGGASKRSMGSSKTVTNMLAHLLMQRETAITRAEKNRVGMALYGLALTQPNSEFWTVIKPQMKDSEIEASLQAMGVPPDAMDGMERAPTTRTVDKTTGKVVNRTNPMYKNLPNAIVVKVAGQDRVILFNADNERSMRLVANLKNLDAITGLDIASSIIGKATRWVASLATQYNPAFGMVNALRDAQGAIVNLSSTPLAGKQAQVLGNIPAAVIGIARELRDGKRTDWSDLYVQFREDGAQTGFRDALRDPNERTKQIAKELEALAGAGGPKGAARKAAGAILDLMDDFNGSLENGTRLAAYKAALDQGISRPQAAKLARELTVDFNRKGGGTVLREFGPMYAFLNASIQGTARTVQTLAGPAGKKIIAGGIALGVLQAIMLAAAGYDDDEIAEFSKTRALIIPSTGKNYIQIPLPLGLHVLPNTGRVLTELAMSGAKEWQAKAFSALGQIAGAFNPLGGGDVTTGHGFLTTILPTVLDPVADLAANKDFAERSISKEVQSSDPRPGYMLGREGTLRTTTGQAYQSIAKSINTIMGGGEFRKGKLDPTPEEVRYIFTAVGGGLLREVEKSINSSVIAARGDTVPANMLPLGSRFAGTVDDAQVQKSRFYKNSQKIDALKAEMTALKKSGQGDKVAAVMQGNQVAALYKLNERISAKLGKINHLAMENIHDTAMLKQFDSQRTELMRSLNDTVRAMEKEGGK